ncbi:hypothetical protein BLNAU_17047 [Blattamonas nauphoetae]|uniref:Uncharacterized protein n=1 Tax=Blattamonas nauphoetae TaxID=2049346 RepID=A0ABQ9XCJ3_9EUKA|nr:hypothetical protein BLNAU_17047 [Blattamonas nauphoetae]
MTRLSLIDESSSALTITQCFFHKCTCTGSSTCGGAVCVRETGTECTISLSFSSFADCKNTGATASNLGGSVFSDSKSQIFVTECFFENGAAESGGALYVTHNSNVTVVNCAFVSCSAFSGGGIQLVDFSKSDAPDYSLFYLQFRGCSATDAKSNDLFVAGMSMANFNKKKVYLCNSTSGVKNVYLATGTGWDMSSFVPQLSSTPTVEVSVSFSGDIATVTAEASEGVKGTMGILLEGRNVPRLVHVQFGDSTKTSTTGTAVVSSGANGILPPAEYELRASSLATDYFIANSLHAADSSLSSDGNTADISVYGFNLGFGSYSMLIRNGDDPFNISLTRLDSTILVGEAPLNPEDAEGRLEWSTEYEVELVLWVPLEGDEQSMHFVVPIAFTTPAEPARICSCTRAVLNKDRTEVTISLEGRALGDSLGSIWVSFGDTFWKSSSMRRISETLCEADFLVASSESVTHLKYKGEYTVCLKPAETSTLLVDSGITVRVPAPPLFFEVQFEFTNSLGTGCIAILTGSDLVVGTEYEVKLNTSHTFSIVVKSSTRAESSEMLIGFEGSLAYSADILIESVKPTNEESGIALPPSIFTGQTKTRPKVNEIFVDTEKGQIQQACGDSSRPCSTMDVAWRIMRTLDISQPILYLLKDSSLSSQMTIDNGMSVLMQNGMSWKPALNIPSSAVESATSALIVVSSALLNIQNIDIVVGSSKPSFILISASSSEMILKDGLMTITSSITENRIEVEELCAWTTGLIELVDSELDVMNNKFFNISQGAIRMKGGQLKIDASVFRDNIPSSSPFPSIRRNIACSEGGTIQIGSLSAGDGFDNPSAWISSDGCSIESTEVNANSPLFIPTLSSDSTSKLDKKTKSFTLTIEGTILIPCSLFLEVFEVRKVGAEVSSTQIPLTVDSAESFTETKIVVILPSSSFDTLDDSLEWRGRLVYGQNETTTNSFLIQLNSSHRVPPPHITSIDCMVVNSLQNMCKIRVRGTDFVVGTECEVTLNNTLRFTMRFKTSSEGESEEVSIGKNGKLQYNTRYTLTEVAATGEDDEEILHSGSLWFETEERNVMEVIVREGGSDEMSECGTIGKPCESVLVGWRVGEGNGVEGVVVKIDGSAGFGGRVVVGEKTIEIGGLFERKNDLKVESKDLMKDGDEGVVSVSGGRVVIVGVQLILPSGWEMGESRVRSVMSGFGECVLHSVSIVSGWKGEGVGMGLVSWLGGSLSVEKIEMEGVEMESDLVLVNCSSLKKEVSLEMTKCRFVEVGTRNAPLVCFSSKSKESHFEMRDCVFVSLERVESGEVGDGMGVIVVSTCQEKTSIVNCMFSNCGTVEGRRGSWKKGGVLIVEVGSSKVGERKEVDLLGNVFVDSCVSWSGSGEERRGGIAVWSVGVGETKIDLCGSWFEETSVSGVVFDVDSSGVPVVEGKRKVVRCLSGCDSVGLVVVAGRVLPVISRSGSSFSGCSLRVVSGEGGNVMDQHTDEL